MNYRLGFQQYSLWKHQQQSQIRLRETHQEIAILPTITVLTTAAPESQGRKSVVTDIYAMHASVHMHSEIVGVN